jgi:hypothetical protein
MALNGIIGPFGVFSRDFRAWRKGGEMIRTGMIGLALSLLIGLAGCDMPAGSASAPPLTPYNASGAYGGNAMGGGGSGGGGGM